MSLSTKMQAWLLAARPRTLPAAMAPVVMGCALAFRDGRFNIGPALAALAGALLLQVGANFANDFMDFQKGADSPDRLGPPRMTAAGRISLREMQVGTAVVFGLASLCGVYLALTSGWPVIVIGLLSILAALAYTGGPYPLGYHGLGEVFVLIFFGLAAVGGTYFVQTQGYSLAVLAASIPVGCLIAAILVVNNLRDIKTDRAAGKRTNAVRYGEAWTRNEFRLLLAVAFVLPLIMVISYLVTPWVLLCVLSLPMALNLSRHVGADRGSLLNLSLAATGSLALVYSLLFAAGLVISHYF